jgi:hypothetical protein
MANSRSQPGHDPSLCQIESAQGGGRLRRPGSLYVAGRILHNLRNHGLLYTLRATFGPRISAVRKRFRGRQAVVSTPVVENEVLALSAGEIVEVKSLREILRTLDDKGKYRGLVFTPEMRKHCGKRYRVYKRLELMFDEYHKSQRRVKNTVLLEGVVCEGAGLGCDRSCFLYWREAWLRRV